MERYYELDVSQTALAVVLPQQWEGIVVKFSVVASALSSSKFVIAAPTTLLLHSFFAEQFKRKDVAGLARLTCSQGELLDINWSHFRSIR